MAKTEHSKLPWNELEHEHGFYSIHSGETGRVAEMVQWCEEDIRKANAEFIVRACNSFYPMLEALKGLVQEAVAATVRLECSGISAPHLKKAVSDGIEALKNAEGE
jgi:hypothetical protein